MRLFFSTIFGILVLALLSAGLVETSLALGQHQSISPEPTKTKSPNIHINSSTPMPITVVPVQPTLSTATVNGFVHLRSAPNTSADILYDLNSGSSVSYTQVDDGLWQAVTYQGYKGYVYKSYLNY
jgi:uncharacterized protein YgiM (DUF1202 family)